MVSFLYLVTVIALVATDILLSRRVSRLERDLRDALKPAVPTGKTLYARDHKVVRF